MTLPILQLLPGKERSVERGHLWVFSGALAPKNPQPPDGALVEVRASNSRFLARGQYQQSGAIRVRILTREPEQIDHEFWTRKLRAAIAIRNRLGLLDGPDTTAARLVNGEGDFLPGLIIDYFAGNVVIQTHSRGMELACKDIANALIEALEDRASFICHKPVYIGPDTAGEKVSTLYGAPVEPWFRENGFRFRLDWAEGQKTGFFLDQRDHRAMLSRYAPGRTLLNAFSYTGAFSVYAAAAGAAEVITLDSSERAIQQAKLNLEANGFATAASNVVVGETLRYLKEAQRGFDLIVLDPPAFAKRLSARHSAVQGYKRLNLEALRNLNPGGILFTFSCSQAVDASLFNGTITAAVIESGRNARILHRLAQPADHPINPCHPESEYLKGLILTVD